MDALKYLYFSCVSGIFTFAIAPLLWIGSLFVARINRPQIIKSVLFLDNVREIAHIFRKMA